MRFEVRDMDCSEIRDWSAWPRFEVNEEHQSFGVIIGASGVEGVHLFYVRVASVAWLRHKRRGQFIGLSVDRFDRASVEQAIRGRVDSVDAPTMEELAAALAPEFRWEYAGMASNAGSGSSSP